MTLFKKYYKLIVLLQIASFAIITNSFAKNDIDPLIEGTTLAVLYFENNSISNAERLEPFKKGLADTLITELGRLKNIRIVERTKLESVLTELNLGSTGLVDEKTAGKIGKLLGAEHLLLGSFMSIGEMIRLDARIVSVESGKVMRAAMVSGRADDIFDLEDELVKKVSSGLKTVPVSAEQKKAAKIDFDAMLLFSEGLDHLDKKRYREAKRCFEKALSIAPDFNDARKRLDELSKVNQN